MISGTLSLFKRADPEHEATAALEEGGYKRVGGVTDKDTRSFCCLCSKIARKLDVYCGTATRELVAWKLSVFRLIQ